jgi:hypothetical protein
MSSSSRVLSAYSSFGVIFIVSSAVNPACRNCFPMPKSPQWIPLAGKSSSWVVAAHRVLILPNMVGINPSRLYVKAHQHPAVMSSMRNVAIHNGYAA